MGIEVVLQDERGNSVEEIVHDPKGVIAASLPGLTDGSYCCVRFIDPYGDAVFNPRQARAMIEEWDRLRDSFLERDAEVLWENIRKLIVRCSEEPHTYLKFVGD